MIRVGLQGVMLSSRVSKLNGYVGDETTHTATCPIPIQQVHTTYLPPPSLEIGQLNSESLFYSLKTLVYINFFGVNFVGGKFSGNFKVSNLAFCVEIIL